ncbi:hypothetical protein NUU61_006547 [Penicillium alfredii]|uniref:Uncharacterized protein n=1 Tax=Penicillium alfredii TaxID=1506179 RepID=A0A9W9F141_9EURO|nr:uncharacterized protein NUU61_006547 [Penicillium alfredii]KAJ5091677.1 hypothetical protein NUU61_006547 [Penicillium alfredii]
MASTESSSVEDLGRGFFRDGFLFVKDTQAGQRVEEMETNSIPFASERGLGFYKINVLDDPRKRHTLDSSFKWFGLGLYRTFGAMPGDYAFRQSDPASGLESLLIQFWKRGSKVTFWKASHLEQVVTMKGENNLWRAPRVALTRLGLEPVEVTFENGGFSIRDTRLFVEVSEGSAITFGIASKDVLDKWWAPMKLHESLEKVVNKMEGPNCGMNVTYFDGKYSTRAPAVSPPPD